MDRASKVELEELRLKLSSWIELDVADVLLNENRGLFGFFARSQGGLKIWREAWLAIQFARKVRATSIKMQDAPDAVFKIGSDEVEVEFTEARSIDAMKAEEFEHWAELENSGQRIPPQYYDPAPQCRAVGHQVHEAIINKVGKPYSSRSVLAVYASCLWLTEFENEMTSAIEKAIIEYHSNFAEIWVLAGGRFFRSKALSATSNAG